MVTKGCGHFLTLTQGSATITISNLLEPCFSFYLLVSSPISKRMQCYLQNHINEVRWHQLLASKTPQERGGRSETGKRAEWDRVL